MLPHSPDAASVRLVDPESAPLVRSSIRFARLQHGSGVDQSIAASAHLEPSHVTGGRAVAAQVRFWMGFKSRPVSEPRVTHADDILNAKHVRHSIGVARATP